MLRRRSIPPPSRPVLSRFLALPFFFFLYINVRIPCRLFLSARMGLYDVPSHCRAALRELSSSPRPSIVVLPCDSYPILYIRKNAEQPSRIPRGLFQPRNYSPDFSLTFADSRGYKFPSRKRDPSYPRRRSRGITTSYCSIALFTWISS